MGKLVGIDLGTSTSEIAYFSDGKPVIIPNHIGEYITPSVVNISADGKIIVGTEAKEKLLLEPECTFMEVKRLMGSKDMLSSHGELYTPQQMSAFILKYLTDCASEYLKEPVTRAVITVPAYFSDEQRRATIEAGKLCGLTVERIINEPTAAALAYGVDHMQDCTNILVYDLGGGTLDVTVLEMFEGVVEVRASSGNNKLGGKDFDESVIDYILGKFSEYNRASLKKNMHAMVRLKKEAELCKIALSTEDKYNIALPFFANIGGKPISIEETITKRKFEELISDKINATEEQLKTALNDAGMKTDDIDLVLLVGGSTRIPYVYDFIAKYFGKDPQKLLDPDLAVIQGAAVQAGIMENLFAENELVLTDVCPYTLGTSVLKGSFASNGFFDDIVFDPIIPRNVTIPTTIEKTYYTAYNYQKAVKIKVYQGEYSDPERNNFLNEFMLDGIPPAQAGKESIKVAFSYDVNGILNVEASIVSTGKKASVTISTQEEQMTEEIDVSGWRSAKNSAKVAALIRKAERILRKLSDDDIEDNILDDMIRILKEALIKELSDDDIDLLKDELVEYLLEIEENEEEE